MNKQRGMTLISWVFVLGIIAFFATLVIRLLPMYQEYYGVVRIMENMKVELQDNKMTKAQVKSMLGKRFNTGYIESVKNENIEMTRDRQSHVSGIAIDYEVRVPFIAQVSLVGHFQKEINIDPKRR
mgnify:CR=1 FL=1